MACGKYLSLEEARKSGRLTRYSSYESEVETLFQ